MTGSIAHLPHDDQRFCPLAVQPADLNPAVKSRRAPKSEHARKSSHRYGYPFTRSRPGRGGRLFRRPRLAYGFVTQLGSRRLH